MNVVLNASSENLNKMHVFPTPESPISNNLNNKSYDFFAISLSILFLERVLQLHYSNHMMTENENEKKITPTIEWRRPWQFEIINKWL